MALQVSGKTALVTGGGSGICLEFTKLLLSQGCNVLVADLALRPEAEEVINGKPVAGGKARAVFKKTDVTDWNQLQAAFDEAVKQFGEINIVCPGAGVFEPVSFQLHICKSSLPLPPPPSPTIHTSLLSRHPNTLVFEMLIQHERHGPISGAR
jgi:NAD(P)-dependent dehydrogenase (short-subunit alcohol dehydrogenase family)